MEASTATIVHIVLVDIVIIVVNFIVDPGNSFHVVLRRVSFINVLLFSLSTLWQRYYHTGPVDVSMNFSGNQTFVHV